MGARVLKTIPSLLLAAVLALTAGCMDAGDSRPAVVPRGKSAPMVNLHVGVGGVNGLGKGATISLAKLVIVLSSSANDTVRDTITALTTPSLDPVSTSSQVIGKNYELKALRSWKMLAISRDALDSVIHRDSAFLPVLYAGDTAMVYLSLAARYAMYEARFLSLPDSIQSATPSQPKQALCINRLVLKVDGAVIRDSSSADPCFLPDTTHALAYDYIGFGTKDEVSSGTSEPLYGIHFPSPDTGFAVGRLTALRTIDGGQTWSSMTGASPKTMRSVFFTSTATGVTVGDSTIRRTTDGGASWVAHTTPVPMISRLTTVHFLDANLGFAAGNNGVYRTTDGGDNWAFIAGVGQTYSLRAVYADTLWTVGASNGIGGPPNSTIRQLADNFWGWLTFAQVVPTTRTLRAVFPVNPRLVFAVGDTGTILRTINGGATWTAKPSGTTRNLAGVHFLDATTGFAVGAGGLILSTSDSGNTWVSEASPTSANLNAVTFIGRKGYAVGDNGTIVILNGPRLVQMLAYGPLGSWDVANPLFSGSKYINAVPGVDAAIPLVLQWTGPVTGTGKIEAELGKVGKVTVNGTVPDVVIP